MATTTIHGHAHLARYRVKVWALDPADGSELGIASAGSVGDNSTGQADSVLHELGWDRIGDWRNRDAGELNRGGFDSGKECDVALGGAR